jgi:hypothetical protein
VQHTIGLAVIWGLGLQGLGHEFRAHELGTEDRPINRRRAALLPLLILFFAPGPFINHVYKGIVDFDVEPVFWWGLDVGGLGLPIWPEPWCWAWGCWPCGASCTRLDVRTLPWAWPLGLALAEFSQPARSTWALPNFSAAPPGSR